MVKHAKGDNGKRKEETREKDEATDG